MVIKKINELLQAANVNPTDLFVLQQGNTAKALTGETLENWLLSLQKVHGTIKDWRIDKTGEFTFNLVLILTDNAEITVPMSNGRDGKPGPPGPKYVPTVASKTQAGIVKVGFGLSATADGELSVDEGKWELINKITVLNDSTINFDSDSNGKHFNLKKLKVKIKNNTDRYVSAQYFANTDLQINRFYFQLKPQEAVIVDYSIDSGYWNGSITQPIAKLNIPPTILAVPFNDVLKFPFTGSFITAFKSYDTIAAGVEFELYGVRA